jgi:hypothetical protein
MALNKRDGFVMWDKREKYAERFKQMKGEKERKKKRAATNNIEAACSHSSSDAETISSDSSSSSGDFDSDAQESAHGGNLSNSSNSADPDSDCIDDMGERRYQPGAAVEYTGYQ